jgi:thymidylate kinase
MEKNGRLFVFEGPDSVGKTELSHQLAETLIAAGNECELLSFPGKESGTLGSLVYDLHHQPKKVGINQLTPTSLQMLHVAAHIDNIESRILPALHAGKTVILDRFWWSTKVYGQLANLSNSFLKLLIASELEVWSGVEPTIMFLIERDRPLEFEITKYWKSCSKLYALLAKEQQKLHHVCRISNNDTINTTLEIILNHIDNNAVKSRNSLSLNKPVQLSLELDDENIIEPNTGPIIFSSIAPAKATQVFDTYWKFAVERQAIFFRRLQGNNPPWTTDPILLKHKFTNAYRASDRVSQYLIKNVIYEGDQSPNEVFFRTLLFKLFNKIETWKLLLEKLGGGVSYEDYTYDRYDEIFNQALKEGRKIYSAAYIMPSGSRAFPAARKHQTHLQLLDRMMQDELAYRLTDAKSMQQVFDYFLSYPSIGNFLAYQYAIDINYGPLTNFSEMEFVMPGPGAMNGIRKCFSSLGGLNETNIIKMVTERQDIEFERLGLEFQSLWGRKLQLIDCQNLFCEVDKYSRVKHPEIAGVTQRTKIKQLFQSNFEPVSYWYPPKWKLNDLIADNIKKGNK